MPQTIAVRAGDTEPLDMDLSATGLTTLAASSSILAYFRKRGASLNHVDGVACAVVSGLRIRFDPVGAKSGGGDAFDSPGLYYGHVKVTWSDADITRHPGDEGQDVRVQVGPVLG